MNRTRVHVHHLQKRLEWLPLVVSLVLFALSVAISQESVAITRGASTEETRIAAGIQLAADMQQLLIDAESVQRGYLLSRNVAYRQAYEASLTQLEERQSAFLDLLRRSSAAPREPKVREVMSAHRHHLKGVLQLFRYSDTSAALEAVNPDECWRRGLQLRTLLGHVRSDMQSDLDQRLARIHSSIKLATRVAMAFGICACTLLGLGTWRLLKSSTHSQILVEQLIFEEEKYRKLASSLQKAHEEERASTAREIHDEIGQNLTAAKIDITMSLTRTHADDGGVQGRLAGVIELLDRTIQIGRRISTDLRPPILDHCGLLSTITLHLRDFEERSRIATNWRPESTEPSLLMETKIALFRVLQEALTNVLRHSRATRVDVWAMQSDVDFSIHVQDNGVGMDVEAHRWSLGMLGMRERIHGVGGQFEVHSEGNAGVRIVSRVPLTVDERSSA